MAFPAAPSLPFRLFWRFVAGGLVALPSGMALLAMAGGPREPWTLAALHWLALGWIAPTVLGALAQLAPVATGARVLDTRLLAAVQALLLAGAGLMAAAFASGRLGFVPLGGTLALAALLTFALAQARALLAAPRRGFAGLTIALALGGLLAGAGLGGAMALAFRHGAFAGWLAYHAAHAHLLLAGWLSVLIVGLSYTLLPMFTLASGHPPGPGRAAVGLLAAGSALSPFLPPVGMALLALGALVYAFDARRLFARRLKRRLDPALRLVAGAIACLPALVVLGSGAALGLPGWDAAYGFLALTGWIGGSLLGYLYKIVPFITWYHRFGRFTGGGRKPLADELVDARLAGLAWWLLALGVPTTTLALVLGLPAGWGAAIATLGTAVAAADLLAAPLRKRREAMSYPIIEVLKDVIDPEYGLSVVDLGLIYGVEAGAEGTHVRMTLTTPNCPVAGWLVAEVEATVTRATRRPTHVELVWEPAWTPERITPYGRAQLQA